MQSAKQWTWLACGMLVVLAAVVGAATAEDWLGRCEEANNTTSAPTEVPLQKCLNPFACSENGNVACGRAGAGTCKNNPNLTTVAHEWRTIDVGDCTTVSGATGCYECQSSSLICFVAYSYRGIDEEGCFDRCPIPEWYLTQGPPKCIP